jgi:hypothetical protein
MKYFFVSLISVFLMLLISCSENPTEPEDGNNNQSDVTVTVGNEGGSIEYENVSVSVPPGTFDSSLELGLSSEQTDASFSESAVSSQYSLNGLPETFSQPIEVTLQTTTTVEGEIFVAVGYSGIPTSLQQEAKIFEYLEAEVQEGDSTIVASIPPTASLGKLAKSNVDGSFSLSIAAIGGHSSYTTAEGHFRIQFPTSVADDIPNLGNYLEDAYKKIKAIGFSYEARTKWPVVVKVKKLDASVDGYFAASFWGDNGGTLEFNMDKLGEAENLRTTAGHEFLHLIQDLYDPRLPVSRVKFAPTQLWLDEATAVWVEEMFSESKDYVSNVRSGNIMAPYDGMHLDGSGASTHGYGMSAMIKYLAGRFGDQVIKAMYQEIYAGKHPVYAVSNSISEATSTWYPDFLKKYTLGEIYGDVQTANLITHTSTKKYTVSSLNKDSTNLSFSAPNLSGHFYDVRLDFPESSEENASAVFTAADCDIIMFSFKGSDIKYENWGYGSVTVNDLMSQKKNGRHLLALVCNTNFGSPHDAKSNIPMNIKINPVVNSLTLPFTHVQVKIFTNLYFQDQDGNTEWEYTFMSASPFQGGGFDASGNYYCQWSDGGDEGLVVAKVNMNTGMLTEFSVTYVDDYSSWGEMDYATITLKNMEPDIITDTEIEYYELYTSDACNNIGHINYREEFSTGDFKQSINWQCDDDTKIEVKFYIY